MTGVEFSTLFGDLWGYALAFGVGSGVLSALLRPLVLWIRLVL